MKKCDNCPNNAVGIFNLGKDQLHLCMRCHKHFLIRETFDKELLLLMDYITKCQYDPALSFLKGMMDRYKGLDPLGKLDNQLIGFEAYLLTEQGQLDEALDKHRLLSRTSTDDLAAFFTSQLAMANILDLTGRPEEALKELSHALEVYPNTEAPILLNVLCKYSDIAKRGKKEIPDNFRSFIGAIAAWYGIQIAAEQIEHGSIEDTFAVIRANIRKF